MATTQSRIDSNGNGGNLDSSLQLRNHLETLPQELYNQIYDLTFTADVKVRLHITSIYIEELERMTAVPDYFDTHMLVNESLPPLFHVDRQSRQKFAESYFGNPESLFVFYIAASDRMPFEISHLGLIPRPRCVWGRGGPSSRRSRFISLIRMGWKLSMVEKFELLDVRQLWKLLDEHVWGEKSGVK